MLPHPRRLPLVPAERFDRADHQAARPVGPKPQVGLEQDARAGSGREPVVEALRKARVVLRRVLVRIVVEKDDVEVGRVAQFLAAELAVADDGKTRLVEVPAAQPGPAQLQRDLQHDVGEVREMIGEPLDGQRAGQILGEQPENLRVVRLAQRVHLPLGVARELRELPPQVPGEFAPVQRRMQKARVEQLVEQYRMPVEELGRPARGAHQGGKPFQGLGMLVEEGKIGGAPADGLDQVHAARERRIRIPASRRLLDHARHERVEAFAARLRQVPVAACGANRVQACSGAPRVAESERAQSRFHGAAVVFPPQRRERVPRRSLVREHVLEMARYALAVGFERGVERRP